MATYMLISSVTLSTTASSIEFTSIPQTYTDLCILLSARNNSGGALGRTCFITFNGNTSSYTYRLAEGTGSGVNTGSGSTRVGGITPGPVATSNVFSNIITYIPNYKGSNHKSFSIDSVMENSSTSVYNTLVNGTWANSGAITSIAITNDDGSSYVANSTAYLYGISNA